MSNRRYWYWRHWASDHKAFRPIHFPASSASPALSYHLTKAAASEWRDSSWAYFLMQSLLLTFSPPPVPTPAHTSGLCNGIELLVVSLVDLVIAYFFCHVPSTWLHFLFLAYSGWPLWYTTYIIFRLGYIVFYFAYKKPSASFIPHCIEMIDLLACSYLGWKELIDTASI